MRSVITINRLLKRVITSQSQPQSQLSLSTMATQTQSQAQKLDRIAEELMSLNPIELNDYSTLFRLKMGLKSTGPSPSSLSSGPGPSSSGPAQPGAKTEEKTAFDIRLEKFDAGAKIKVIKEVRSFTELGLKEAKDLVEKAPIVVKKGVTKEEGDAIVDKLKQLGATVVLE